MDTPDEMISKEELSTQAKLLLELLERWPQFKNDEDKLLSSLLTGSPTYVSYMSPFGSLMKCDVEARRFFFAVVETILQNKHLKSNVDTEKEKNPVKDGSIYQQDALETICGQFFLRLWKRLSGNSADLQLVHRLRGWFVRDVKDIFDYSIVQPMNLGDISPFTQTEIDREKEQIETDKFIHDRKIQLTTAWDMRDTFLKLMKKRAQVQENQPATEDAMRDIFDLIISKTYSEESENPPTKVE